MRRVACVALPEIRLEIAREEISKRDFLSVASSKGRDAPPFADSRSTSLAVVVARPGGTVKTERDVLGNTRLDVVSREARALGIRPGQTVAAARAKSAALRVWVVAQGAVRAALERIAEVGLAFGPTVSFDLTTDVVWIEIGGCAHLAGGEPELAQTLGARVRELGHVCRVSIADGPRIAAAIARYAPASRSRSNDPLVVPAGGGAVALRDLPLEALSLETECTQWLRDLGLSTCGDLQKLPRRSLGARLGSCAQDTISLLSGDDSTPLDAWRPPEVPEERIELEWGASSVDSLAFVTKALCDRLAARLSGRALAATRVAIVLGLDRGLLCEGAPFVSVLDLTLPVPIAKSSDLFAVVRTRLERLKLPAPALAVTLRALEVASVKPRSLHLLTPEPKVDKTLLPLVAELAADLGGANVGTLMLADTWSPEGRTRLVPFGAPRTPASLSIGALVTSATEPTRLVPPLRLSIDAFEGPPLMRLEAVEWWREGGRQRDFFAVWDGAALAWVELSASGEALLRGWID